jgi:hypothetical protein
MAKADAAIADASVQNKGMFRQLSPEQQIAYLLRVRQLLEEEFTKRPPEISSDDLRTRIELSRLLNGQIYSILTNMANKTTAVFTEHMYPLLVCAAVLLGGDGSARYGIIATLLFGIIATESAKPGENYTAPVKPLILRIKDQLLTCGERGIELGGEATLAIGQLLAKIESIRVLVEQKRNAVITKSFNAIVDVGSTIVEILNGLVDCWGNANGFNASQSSQESQSSQGSMGSMASNASTTSNASTMSLLVGERVSLRDQLTNDALTEVIPVVNALLDVLEGGEDEESGIGEKRQDEKEDEARQRKRLKGGRKSRRYKKKQSTLKRRRMKRRRTRKGKKRRHTKKRR